MQQTGSLWLIKSSGRVIGPFGVDKVAELLKSREISVLDEVSKPMRRWQTIQYHDEFKDVVDSLRKATLSERTEANWTPTGVTSNLTQTLTDVTDNELTEEISDEMTFSSTAKEIVIHNIQEDRAKPPTPSGGRYQTSQGQNTAIQRQVEKTTRGLWIATILVLVIVGLYIGKKRMGGTAGGTFEPRPTAAKLKHNVVGLVQIGRYAEALRELKNFYPDPMQSGDLAIYFGSLLIQVEGQTTMGRRLLNQVLSARRPETKQAYTGLGMADLLDGQLDSARDNFEKALAIDSVYPPALVNMASVYIQKGEYARAKAQAQRALSVSPMQGEAILAIAEAQLYLFKLNNNLAELAQVNKQAQSFVSRRWDYAAELGFYGLYFDFLARDRGLDEKVTTYLNRDPQLTADHRHNVFIYRSRSQWKVLARFCEQMAEKLGDGTRTANLLAACYRNEQRWDNARRQIEKAVNLSPRDALVQAWYALILKESGDVNQASIVQGRAMEYNRRGDYTLPLLIQGRFCQSNKDVECARESFQKIYEQNLDNLPAIAGMAWVQAQNRTYGEALKHVDKGLALSPDYIPLLEMRQQAERDGWYAGN